MEKVDKLDKKILGILSTNARMPFKDVAAECGVSRAAVHQRVQHLIDNGVITGSGFYVNPKSLGYTTCTYVGINLERGSIYKEVVSRLLCIPEIVECHFTTGSYTMLLKLYARRGVDRDPHLARAEHQARDNHPTRRGLTRQSRQWCHSHSKYLFMPI